MLKGADGTGTGTMSCSEPHDSKLSEFESNVKFQFISSSATGLSGLDVFIVTGVSSSHLLLRSLIDCTGPLILFSSNCEGSLLCNFEMVNDGLLLPMLTLSLSYTSE